MSPKKKKKLEQDFHMAFLNLEGMVRWYILQFDYLSLAPVIAALAFLLNLRGFHLLLV